MSLSIVFAGRNLSDIIILLLSHYGPVVCLIPSPQMSAPSALLLGLYDGQRQEREINADLLYHVQHLAHLR